MGHGNTISLVQDGGGWTGMGELKCLTCSQVEEGRWGRLGIPVLGPTVGRQLLLKLPERRRRAVRAVAQARMQVCKRWQKDER